MEKKYLSLKALANNTGISISSLRKYIKKGLPHYNTGKKIFVDFNDFSEWFEKKFKQTSDNGQGDLETVIASYLLRNRMVLAVTSLYWTSACFRHITKKRLSTNKDLFQQVIDNERT